MRSVLLLLLAQAAAPSAPGFALRASDASGRPGHRLQDPKPPEGHSERMRGMSIPELPPTKVSESCSERCGAFRMAPVLEQIDEKNWKCLCDPDAGC